MQLERITKDAFCVIGRLGSTADGPGFVQKLWAEANAHFAEVAHLALRREDGTLAGLWGAMSDPGMNFQPWEENFTRGLYLAGVEAAPEAAAPAGWRKWIVPGFEGLKALNEGPETFPAVIAYMRQNGLTLAGAVHDFTDPSTGKDYTLFPLRLNDSKAALIRAVKATVDPFAVCGLHCDFCFLTEWCGGCRSACSVCSYAALYDDNICPNVRCAGERGLSACCGCADILVCTTGFYEPGCDGAPAAKALALYRKAHGDAATADVLRRLHGKHDFRKLQEVLTGDVLENLRRLEET